MRVNISTLGSCSSRNIFSTAINKNYKRYFKINDSIEGVTFISLMSKEFKFDKKLLNSNNDYDNRCVSADVSKDFLKFLKKNKIDYLIIDTYFDVFNKVIQIEDNIFISDSERLKRTGLNKMFKNSRKISIYENFEEYYTLFKKAIKSFFEFIEKNCSSIKIILNCSRSVFKFKSNNEIVEDYNLKKKAKLNIYRDLLDKYILENFDVDVLEFDKNTLADQNHIFGLHDTHYELKYYHEKTRQLNTIIQRNHHLDYTNEINVEFRNIHRRNMIQLFNQQVVLNKYNHLISKFKKYLTARIDMKNENSNNSIEIIENTDKHSILNYPKWFKDEKGQGLCIHTQKQNISIKIKCNGFGELVIRFMGEDIKDKFGNRIPIFIKYNSIYVDGKKIDNEKLVCHDSPLYYKQHVKDKDIITLDINWEPF